MKKLIFIILISIAGFSFLNSCKHNPHIGLLMANLEQARWEKDVQLFQEKIKEMKATCDTANAMEDADKQFEKSKEMITNVV